MSKHLKRKLPIIAVAAAVLTLITLILLGIARQSALDDTGETDASVEVTIRQIQDLHPGTLDDTAFKQALIEVEQAPFIAQVRLFNPDGTIVNDERRTASGRAGAGIRRILTALPPDLISTEQEGWLVAASTVMAEGEHSDVFNYMLRPLTSPDGSIVGIIGVTYDKSPWLSSAGIGWILGVLLVLIGLCVYWLALPWWVFLDAGERGERAWAWAIFVFIGNFVALLAYILAHSFQHESPADAGSAG